MGIIEMLLSGGIGIIGLLLLVKLFTLPFKLVWNGVWGMIILWLVNLLGAFVGLQLKITFVSALIAGFFGIPGVFCLIAYELLKR